MRVIYPTLALVTILVTTAAFTELSKEQYELQERCGKQAAKVFEKEYESVTDTSVTDTKEGQNVSSYRNHYNPTLNKCFFLVTPEILAYRANHNYTASLYSLIELTDHKEYGSFYKRDDVKAPMQCVVNGKSCNSEDEWELLIAPYMSDAP